MGLTLGFKVEVRILFRVRFRELVRLVRVGSWVTYYFYKSPHKDGNTSLCVGV